MSTLSTRTIRSVLAVLKRQFPHPGAMELSTPGNVDEIGAYRTLIAVILSARTRDEQVLKFLPAFFGVFPTPEHLAEATTKHIEAQIDTIGMYRQKAKHLQRTAKTLVDQFHGRVPRTMHELVALDGVGRKTASVVLSSCFGIPSIAVDSHVHRVTNRLGWVRTKTPEKTEAALLALVPRDVQSIVNQVFVKFGRSICIAGTPRCWMCPIRTQCAYTKKNLVTPKNAATIQEDLRKREEALEHARQRV